MVGLAVICLLGSAGATAALCSQETPPQATDISSLIKAASGSDVNSVIRSIFLLTQTPQNPDVQKCLIDLFKSEYEPTHTLAALSIGYVKNKSLTEQVAQFLRSDKAWQRRDSAWVLGRDTDQGKRYVKQLIAMLKDDDWQVQMFAAWAVGRLEAKEALPLLRDLAQASKGKRDGAQSETAIEAIERGAYRPRMATPAPWIVVPDVDIPDQALNLGVVMSVGGQTKSDDFLFGVYNFWSDEGRPRLKVSILRETPWMLVFYGGEGKITDVWTKTTVSVNGEYHRRLVEGKD
jgi:hypothetical protein